MQSIKISYAGGKGKKKKRKGKEDSREARKASAESKGGGAVLTLKRAPDLLPYSPSPSGACHAG